MISKKLLGVILVLILSVFEITGCATVAATPDASVGDTPSKGPVGRTMRSNSPKFAACARDSVTVQTGTTQNMQLRFLIDANGNVTRSTVEKMNGPDPDLRGCILRALNRIQFPKPDDGKAKDIQYPLILRPE